MSEEILLNFLEAGVINVGSDDNKLEKLRETAKDLASVLKKAPSQTVRWTLIAVDPEASADDPVVAEAWTALKKNWTTVANTYQSTPVALLRAILLDALVRTASIDDTVAAAFANSARNMLPHMPLGAEAPVWQAAAEQIEDLVDTRAQAEWMTPEVIQVLPMQYRTPAKIEVTGGAYRVNREDLKSDILLASGPHSNENQNPYWPHNNPSEWSKEFSQRIAVAIADAVDSAGKASQVKPVDLSPALNDLASTVENHVSEALKAFSGATTGLERRTSLLWWKEALYSSSTRKSYRAMKPFTAASMMAFDLFNQVPTFSPASVSAFLNEAILFLPSTSSDVQDLPAIVESLLQDELTTSLRESAQKLEPSAEGRGPLLALIGNLSHEALGSFPFRKATGFDTQIRMRPDEWGAHLFRELQAARATRPLTAKRTRGKG
ncbi:GTPase-associated system all-helical protein GASH [Stenotrophomonas geniculata]|jgi:GTPase-associated system helical domain|uniref:GTPase-associated system all-helical protein GASH n=1 Tax=Stenotrophomonas geniculata TaxID=86188 RepID=UPI00383BACF7